MNTPVWDSKTSQNFSTNFDCYIAEALLSEGRGVGNLEETLQRNNVPSLAALAALQKEKLHALPKLEKLFFQIEMPLAQILSTMEKKGILLDTKNLNKIGENIDSSLLTVQRDIEKETQGEININSSTQLGIFLVEKIGVPLGQTKTGKYATNEQELLRFKDQFPILDHILNYRALSKLRSTYVQSLIEKADAHGRVHTTYHQLDVNTGRLASSNPNLQNIPVSSLIGQQIKSCFIASPGHVFASFDYSQQELRILAHLAGEHALLLAFENNQDVHTLTASKLFHIKYDEVSTQQRSIGKTINFGIIYGMSSFGMSEGLHIPQTDAEHFIHEFYISYPNIKSYYDEYLKNAKKNNVAETILGRRRYVFEDPKRKFIDNSMRRMLLNYPIQGSAADLMKKAMIDVWNTIVRKNSDIALLLQIHDDLVFEMPEKIATKDLLHEIEHILCRVYPLKVPLAVDIKIGNKWGELKKMNK